MPKTTKTNQPGANRLTKNKKASNDRKTYENKTKLLQSRPRADRFGSATASVSGDGWRRSPVQRLRSGGHHQGGVSIPVLIPKYGRRGRGNLYRASFLVRDGESCPRFARSNPQ